MKIPEVVPSSKVREMRKLGSSVASRGAGAATATAAARSGAMAVWKKRMVESI